ncbi:hypothetical protein NPIL_287651 [Nephila pilipes]|uniref:Uncharacterized protein n=1 Tax=Nephila pilipes TaxID=299642 RepID=A0A8X6NM49_NEPPI|nr:hypothetical protein NPIL_287651 [Nephila pilipes]
MRFQRRDAPHLDQTQKSLTFIVITNLVKPTDPIATYKTPAITPLKSKILLQNDPLAQRTKQPSSRDNTTRTPKSNTSVC